MIGSAITVRDASRRGGATLDAKVEGPGMFNDEQRIEWIGEFVLMLAGWGGGYLIAVTIDGPAHHPLIAMPLGWRWLLLFLLAAVATRLQWRFKRRRAERNARRVRSRRSTTSTGELPN